MAKDFNLAELHEAIAQAIGERECLVWRDCRLSWAEVTQRTRRLANFLLERGLGEVKPRSQLSPWESGQDHLALYLHNSTEYLESMLGAFKSRTVPFNVNYRYVEEELLYIFRDSGARGVVYHQRFAPQLEAIRSQLTDLELLVQVRDGSGHGLLPGAVDYEQALSQASCRRPPLDWSPDDLYCLYTGGTTGYPKGVLWRQADIYAAALGGQKRPGSGEEFDDLAEIVAAAARDRPLRTLPASPFMHGAAHWSAFNTFHAGGTVVIAANTEHLDPDDLWATVEKERVGGILIIGDAFAPPLLDTLEAGNYDIDSLKLVISGGTALSAGLKRRFLDAAPGLRILDTVGSSESGNQGNLLSRSSAEVSTGNFVASAGNCIVNSDMTAVLEPGSGETGWLARKGRLPLGYLGDAEKTLKTFPVIDGVRYSVPGDRARMDANGMIELLGRESATINSGGEKIFAEEVELALKCHPDVYDAVVVGRPSRRWGQEVVAIVSLREGKSPSESDLRKECARHVARYKLPKTFVFLDKVLRSPSGKADYRWARSVAGSCD